MIKLLQNYKKSEKKLENTKLNLLRINDILSEIEGNLEKLKILGQVITKNDIQDMGKIVVITKNTNINGKKLAENTSNKII